ncbi:hypothetical protein NQ073_23975, partial [Escherichia coli]
NFKNTMSDHSVMTIFGITDDGQKNGIPIGGAPAPKRTFWKMHNFYANGMIYRFNGMKNYVYWVCARINK